MKYSLQKKMFLISLVTTTLSFALVLVCFNLLTSYHIKQQTVTELSQAVSLMKPVNVTITPKTAPKDTVKDERLPSAIPPITSEMSQLPAAATMAAVKIEGIARNVSASLYTQDAPMRDVGFILADLSSSTTPACIYSASAAGSVEITEDPYTASALLGYALQVDAGTPSRTTLNDDSYYVVKADIADQADVVFYKNVQPLEDLASEVNLVLLALLAVSGCLSVAVSMGLSRGMVRSIRKLCNFAGAVGAGDLTPRDLNLKEKELAVLGDEMNDMIRRLAAHDAEQKTFFQNVSHELRTPLMSIQGYAEGIAGSVFSDGELQNAAEIILSESDRLTEMVGNLLYLSRMDSPDRGAKKEAFDCAEALEQTAGQVYSLAAAKDIKLEFTEVPPSPAEAEDVRNSSQAGGLSAFGNREDFQRAVLCILENALRYARSRVTVTVDPDRRTLEITDDGPGIPEEDLPHIFRRFYKGKDGLSGIGLAIADAAVRGLGGTLTAKNCGGACFTISLPQKTASAHQFGRRQDETQAQDSNPA